MLVRGDRLRVHARQRVHGPDVRPRFETDRSRRTAADTCPPPGATPSFWGAGRRLTVGRTAGEQIASQVAPVYGFVMYLGSPRSRRLRLFRCLERGDGLSVVVVGLTTYRAFKLLAS